VVNAGELNVDGSLASSQVTLNDGAILSGSGTTGPVGSNGGIIAPGNSPGILTTGSLVTNDTTTFRFEIGGLNAGLDYDQLQVNGIIDLQGILVVSLVNGFLPTQGDKFLIIPNDLADPVTGSFAAGTFPVTDTPDPFDVWVVNLAENAMAGADGNDISLTYQVPEPSAAGLAALAGAALTLRRRRRTV
jgi:hypothetical protein